MIDIYQDDNAFVNENGMQRPSFRTKDGETIFSIKREIMMENQIGRNESVAYSGGQWGGLECGVWTKITRWLSVNYLGSPHWQN
jgi:hypothetical protein